MIKKNFILAFLIFAIHSIHAQTNIDCNAIETFLSKSENKVKKLNMEDPELIPLHYLLALDIEKEFERFSKEIIPQFSMCKDLNYYEMVNRFDDIAFRLSIKKLKLSTLSKQVDSIFLQKAIRELHYENHANALFFLDKSLQCNPVYPDALLLKAQLLFEEDAYQECLSLLHTLYYEAPLQRKHEIEISSFNMLFYNKLYRVADSLIKIEKAAEALDFFKILETFCTNMPIEYCNDDYYHGILRSREGVYESYLIIAKVAAEKGNKELAQKFSDYAEEYRMANQSEFPVSQKVDSYQVAVISWQPSVDSSQLSVDSSQVVEDSSQVVALRWQEAESRKQKAESELETSFPPHSNNETTSIAEETSFPPHSNDETTSIADSSQIYNQLLIEGMTFALDGNFKKAHEVLKAALELENCNCFRRDERVRILYEALNKAYSK